MYPGWITIGTQDPVGNPEGMFLEVINNPRAFAYAANACIRWLHDCNNCDNVVKTLPGSPYVSPKFDPAPWYDPDDPDSEGFLGLIGLDVEGEESSTRQTSVKMGLNGIGIIGPSYMAPRTLVVRALAIATDECSLQYGLTWLRAQYRNMHNPCGGDTLTFYDCCPCMCEDDSEQMDCWAETYRELRQAPPCLYDGWWVHTYDEEKAGPLNLEVPWWPDTYDEEMQGDITMTWWYTTYDEEKYGPPSDDYWPESYGELRDGPDIHNDPTWCKWIDTYRELRLGADLGWSCCVQECVVPYLRQFYNVRVTEGPTLLSAPALNSEGAIAEIEFTIVAADPVVHGIPQQRSGGTWAEGGTPIVDTAPPPPFVNPYRDAPVTVPEFVPAEWLRDSFDVTPLKEQILTGVEPRLRVRAAARTGPIRLGVWAGETRVAGYTIPFVAQNSAVVVSGSEAFYTSPDGYEPLPAFVRDWDGKWPRPVELPHGNYRVTVDQHPDAAVKVYVDVALAPMGAP